MNLYFLDSSALVKRYIKEPGTQWVQAITAITSSSVILVSRITWVEVHSAFARLAREQTIDPGKLVTTRQLFQYDWANQYHIIELDPEITLQAGQLVQQYVLRAYDSVQLASAVVVKMIGYSCSIWDSSYSYVNVCRTNTPEFP